MSTRINADFSARIFRLVPFDFKIPLTKLHITPNFLSPVLQIWKIFVEDVWTVSLLEVKMRILGLLVTVAQLFLGRQKAVKSEREVLVFRGVNRICEKKVICKYFKIYAR